MSTRILSYTQHLEGIGHLMRSLRIAAGMEKAGVGVTLVVGGVPVEGLETQGVDIVELPPVKAGPGGFSDLRDREGAPVDDAYKDRRRDQLLGLLDRLRPDGIMIEAFPFGRRQMRFELIPLLEAARSRAPAPLIMCSVRDILQENKSPDRVEETIACLRTWFDLVLVHGDPDFADLALTFPRAGEIADLIEYTGMVAGPVRANPQANGEFKVVVSSGGGATGENILKCALKARPKTGFAKERWCVITGPNLPGPVMEALRADVAAGVEIHEFRSDLADLMANAQVSVSRCGYNTAVDIFQTGCRAVVIPNAHGGETEQTRRADILARRNIAAVVHDFELEPDILAAAIDRAAAMAPPAPGACPALDGAANTARMVSDAVNKRR